MVTFNVVVNLWGLSWGPCWSNSRSPECWWRVCRTRCRSPKSSASWRQRLAGSNASWSHVFEGSRDQHRSHLGTPLSYSLSLNPQGQRKSAGRKKLNSKKIPKKSWLKTLSSMTLLMKSAGAFSRQVLKSTTGMSKDWRMALTWRV